jgi:hypothetical protein
VTIDLPRPRGRCQVAKADSARASPTRAGSIARRPGRRVAKPCGPSRVFGLAGDRTGPRRVIGAEFRGVNKPDRPARETPRYERRPPARVHLAETGDTADPVRLSVWPTGQQPSRVQRAERCVPASTAHPAKMLPAIACQAITVYSRSRDLVLDPMCGIGTSVGGHRMKTTVQPTKPPTQPPFPILVVPPAGHAKHGHGWW